MQVISYSDARKNLKSILDRIVDDADTAVITRPNGGDVVVMSKMDYDGLMEALHLLGTEANREHLSRSMDQYQAGQTINQSLELMAELREAVNEAEAGYLSPPLATEEALQTHLDQLKNRS
ncbi:MAG: type II toxin-antitoxin system Phd/YefM family antitoxin [Magnetococcales bacterium]|nr:type II toxin-antitoxin system Phd/YefM family antitoxin [Magnetococcales bacterium]